MLLSNGRTIDSMHNLLVATYSNLAGNQNYFEPNSKSITNRLYLVQAQSREVLICYQTPVTRECSEKEMWIFLN